MIVMEMFIGYCMVYYSTQKSNANSLFISIRIIIVLENVASSELVKNFIFAVSIYQVRSTEFLMLISK